MTAFTESIVEEVALAWLQATGWQVAHGPDIAPDMPAAERANYSEVVLGARLRDALARLNPALPAKALEDAYRKLTRLEGADLIQRNRALHRLLVNGATVEYRTREGEVRGAQARVIDFDEPRNNDSFAVNQFSVTENKHSRRPGVVLFVNGLPLAVVEHGSGSPVAMSRTRIQPNPKLAFSRAANLHSADTRTCIQPPARSILRHAPRPNLPPAARAPAA